MKDEIIKELNSLVFNPYRDYIEGYFSIQKYVESCDQCKGVGFYYTEEMTDYHKGEYTDSRYDCKICAGEGRVTVTKKQFEVKIVNSMSVVAHKDDPILENTRQDLSVRLKIQE